MEIYWVVFLVFYMIWSSAWHITVLGWLSCESSAFEAALLWCYCHKLYTGSSFIKHWCVYNGSWWLRSRSSTQAFFHVSRVVSEPWKNAPFTDAGQLSQLWCSARKESNTYRSPIFTRIVALKINDISDQVFEFSRQNDFFFMQGWFLDKWQVFRCHVQKLNFLSFQSWVGV